MELEEPSFEFEPVADQRPRVPEPPPVRLVAVDDVRALAAAGLEPAMDEFYVGLLKFERELDPLQNLIYKSENFRLHIQIVEPPVEREELRPIGIDVPLLHTLEHQLVDREIEFVWQKGLTPGQSTILLKDPAGNWLEIGEFRRV